MTTRLTKPVTRIVTIEGDLWNVTLDYASITFRAFRSPKRSEIMLPYPAGLSRAAWLNGDRPKRKKKIRRGTKV